MCDENNDIYVDKRDLYIDKKRLLYGQKWPMYNQSDESRQSDQYVTKVTI